MKNDDATIQKYVTPYKYGKPVLAGSGKEGAYDACGVDCPFVFWHNERYFMLHVGFDGKGYQTALAVSDDLLSWEHYAVVLAREEENSRWDWVGAAGTWIIKESDNLYDTPKLRRVDGKYWMVYHSYPSKGYEAGPAEISLAWCEDEDLKIWHRLDKPVFSWKDGEAWEAGGLYKAGIIEHDNTWYLFYNAKDTQKRWIEQTGVAMSKDLFTWERCRENPVVRVSPEPAWDSRFLSDPYVVKDGELWLDFFFGYDGKVYKHAQDGLAVSKDLIHWDKAEEPVLPNGAKGEIDEGHAHKASIFYEKGRLYHFYCATRPWREGDSTKVFEEFRTICVASSQPF